MELNTKIVEELPQMKRETVPLVRQAVGARLRAHVEQLGGRHAPLTV